CVDGKNSTLLRFESRHGAAAHEADAKRLASGDQRLHVPRVADLGHVWQVVGLAKAECQSRFHSANVVFRELLASHAFTAPLLLGRGLRRFSKLQAAAAEVAIVDARLLPKLRGK